MAINSESWSTKVSAYLRLGKSGKTTYRSNMASVNHQLLIYSCKFKRKVQTCYIVVGLEGLLLSLQMPRKKYNDAQSELANSAISITPNCKIVEYFIYIVMRKPDPFDLVKYWFICFCFITKLCYKQPLGSHLYAIHIHLQGENCIRGTLFWILHHF